jgi:hypothetical protein
MLLLLLGENLLTLYLLYSLIFFNYSFIIIFYFFSSFNHIRLQLQAEAEVAELKKSFRRGTGISAREKELEMQAVQDAADREVLMLEIQGLKKQHQSASRGKDQQFNNWVAEHQSESKAMIQSLMEAFEEEMSSMRDRCTETEKMLESATRDLEYLMEENDNLKSRIAHK